MKPIFIFLTFLFSVNLQAGQTSYSGSFVSAFGPAYHANMHLTAVDAGNGSQLVLRYSTDMNFGGYINIIAVVTYEDSHIHTYNPSYSGSQSPIIFDPDNGSKPASVRLDTDAPWNTQAYDGWGNPGLSGYVTASLNAEDQIVSLSPSSGLIAVGNIFSGFAHGAHLGNSYNISVLAGDVNASINPETGAFTISGSGASNASFRVWASAGGGFSRSNDAFGNVRVSASYSVNISIPANDTDFAITYILTQDGVQVGETTRESGDSALIIAVNVPNDTPVTLSSYTHGLRTDGISYIRTGADTDHIPNGPLDTPYTPSLDPASTPHIPPAPSSPKNDPNLFSHHTTNVWSSSTTTAASDALTNQVFREGIDKLSKQDKTTNSTTDSNLLDKTTFNNRLSTLQTTLQSIKDQNTTTKDQADADRTKTGTLLTSTQASDQLTADITSADHRSEALRDQLSATGLGQGVGILGTAPTLASETSYATTAHNIGDAGPIVSGAANGAMDVNPFTSVTLGSLLPAGWAISFTTWIKNIIALSSVVWFLSFVVDRVRQVVNSSMTVTPVQPSVLLDRISRSIVAGFSIGVPVALVAWPIITTILATAILAAPALIAAGLYSAGHLSDIVTVGTAAKIVVGSTGGPFSDVFSYVYLILPVTLLFTIFANSLLVRFADLTTTVVLMVGWKLKSLL